MKTLSWWLVPVVLAFGLATSLPVRAAVLKSVQTGTVAMNPAVQPVAIASVVTARTFVVCEGDTGGVGSNPTVRATCELPNTVNATTLTITTNVADATMTVRWYVVEFLSGVTVQRGLVPTGTFTGVTATVPVGIAAVNLAKTFVLTTERVNSATQTIDEEWTTLAQLTTTTNLQITRLETGVALAVAWQVIQIESASVQSGTTTIPAASAPATAVLGTPVDVSRTFLVFSQNGGTAIGGDEGLYRITGVITNATTLTFQRAKAGAANTQINVAWFAVRMTDGTTVQRNLCGPSGNVSTMPAAPAGCLTLAPAIVPTRSVAFISARGDAASGSPTADLDDTSWKSALAAGAITLTRSAGASNSTSDTVAWQVVSSTTSPISLTGTGERFSRKRGAAAFLRG